MIFIIILSACLIGMLILNYLYMNTNDYKNYTLETQKLKTNNCVDIVNTGSTFAYYGIDYKVAQINGLNLALKPQSLKNDFEMLKVNSHKLNPNAIVLIVISDLAFGLESYVGNGINNKYYGILPASCIEKFSLIKYIQHRYLPVTLHYKNFARFLKDRPLNRELCVKLNENDRDHVKADAFFWCKAWCEEFALQNLVNSDIPNKYLAIFDVTTTIVTNMIEWAQENGYRPVIVNLPVTREMSENFSKEFLKVFYYNNIDKANVSKIPFIDLSLNSKLSDYYLYLDSCRLNLAGREVVTRILIEELKKIGYEV